MLPAHAFAHSHVQAQLHCGRLAGLQGGRTDHRAGRSASKLHTYGWRTCEHQRSVAIVAQGELLVEGPIVGYATDVYEVLINPESWAFGLSGRSFNHREINGQGRGLRLWSLEVTIPASCEALTVCRGQPRLGWHTRHWGLPVPFLEGYSLCPLPGGPQCSPGQLLWGVPRS